jgi:hypothetical protein
MPVTKRLLSARTASVVFFLALSVIPALPLVGKYLGVIGVALFILAAALFALLSPLIITIIRRLVSRRTADVLAVVTIILMTGTIAVVYPRINWQDPCCGTDRDDALRVATTALLSGHYPYTTIAYLGRGTSALPGALLLAIPFVAAHAVPYQNVLWIIVFYAGARFLLRDPRLGLLALWSYLMLPSAQHELVTGGELVANSVYVMGGLSTMLAIVPGPFPRGLKTAAAIAGGIVLSSRLSYVFLVPPFAATLAAITPRSDTIRYGAISLCTCAAITLPFFLYNPSGFSPIHLGYLDTISGHFPHATWMLAAINCTVAALLAWRNLHLHEGTPVLISLLMQAVILISAPLAIMAISEVLLVGWDSNPVQLIFMATCFAVLGFWACVSDQDASIEEGRLLLT